MEHDNVVIYRYLKFLLVAFLTIFSLIWLYTAYLPIAFLAYDYDAMLAKRNLVKHGQLGTVVILGDSRAMAGIKPKALPFSSSNLAFSGSTPIEGYFVTQHILCCKTSLKIAIIAYSPDQYMADDKYWSVSAHVGLLTFADLQAVQRTSLQLHDQEINHWSRDPNLLPLAREVLVAAHFPPFYFGSLIDGFVFLRWFHNLTLEQRIEAAKGQGLFGNQPVSHVVFGEAKIHKFVPSLLINWYFSHMLKQLVQKNLQVKLLSIPINQDTCARMNPALRTSFTNYMQQQVTAQVQIIGPVLPCWPDKYFGDDNHLNAAGANLYTRQLANLMQPQVLTAENSK